MNQEKTTKQIAREMWLKLDAAAAFVEGVNAAQVQAQPPLDVFHAMVEERQLEVYECGKPILLCGSTSPQQVLSAQVRDHGVNIVIISSRPVSP